MPEEVRRLRGPCPRARAVDAELDHVVCSFSGGLDSTALVGLLLAQGFDVTAVALGVGGKNQIAREGMARHKLQPKLCALAELNECRIEFSYESADFLDAFGAGGEVPTRNRRIIDALVAKYGAARYIGLGEYVGCEDWLVQDHVGAEDCDARALTAYCYMTYGLKFRLLTLADFGECRYKSDRLALAYSVLGDDVRHLTSCLLDHVTPCHGCYKCAELGAAFEVCGLRDLCPLDLVRLPGPLVQKYMMQMTGERVQASAWEGAMS